MRLRPTAGLALGVAWLLFAGSAAAAAPRLEPGSAVPGATVSLRAAAFVKPTVTVGGKRATVVGTSLRHVRFVVPKVRPGVRTVVARSGRRSLRARLRVPKPFTGKVGLRLDKRTAASATLDAAGGRVVARRGGVKYELAVPAGALTSPTRITLTPVSRYAGLPFSGAAAGVRLSPDGLVFAAPATLTITLARKSNAPLAGFALDGAGGGLELRPTTGSRRSISVPVPHFSSAGGAGVTEADFAAAVAPLLASVGLLTRSQIQQLLELRDEFDRLFPGFCERQTAICDDMEARAVPSLDALIENACAVYRQSPSFGGIQVLQRLEADRQLLGAHPGTQAKECADEIIRALARDAVERLETRDLFEPSEAEDQLTPAQRSAANLVPDDPINRFEWAWFLAIQGQVLGVADAADSALNAATEALERLADTALVLCDTDEGAGDARLRRGLKLALAAGYLETEFADAIVACHVRVSVLPAEVFLNENEKQQFTATVTGDGQDLGVSWSASGGSVTAGGLYTPPLSAPGGYIVTATSRRNPRRTATATVTVKGCQLITNGFAFQYRQADSDFEVRQTTIGYRSGTVKLAGNCEGTAPVSVDDGIVVEVTRPGGATNSFSHDFSGGCGGGIAPAGPFDLTSRLGAGSNAVKVRLRDLCGQGGSGTSALYLVFSG